MANWKNLTERADRALCRVITEGVLHKGDAHHATLRSLVRRDLLDRKDITRRKREYRLSHAAAYDLMMVAAHGSLRGAAVNTYRHLWEDAHDCVHERARQARANLHAGRDTNGFDFDLKQVIHAPIRLIEAATDTGQWLVFEPGEGTVWVDHTYDACECWIREQIKLEMDQEHTPDAS